MADRQVSRVVTGAAVGLVALGILVTLFGAIAYGVVLLLCGLFLPVFVRRSSE